jgi:hypothetical protein
MVRVRDSLCQHCLASAGRAEQKHALEREASEEERRGGTEGEKGTFHGSLIPVNSSGIMSGRTTASLRSLLAVASAAMSSNLTPMSLCTMSLMIMSTAPRSCLSRRIEAHLINRDSAVEAEGSRPGRLSEGEGEKVETDWRRVGTPLGRPSLAQAMGGSPSLSAGSLDLKARESLRDIVFLL